MEQNYLEYFIDGISFYNDNVGGKALSDKELLQTIEDTKRVIQQLGVAEDSKAAEAFERGYKYRALSVAWQVLLHVMLNYNVPDELLSDVVAATGKMVMTAVDIGAVLNMTEGKTYTDSCLPENILEMLYERVSNLGV